MLRIQVNQCFLSYLTNFNTWLLHFEFSMHFDKYETKSFPFSMAVFDMRHWSSMRTALLTSSWKSILMASISEGSTASFCARLSQTLWTCFPISSIPLLERIPENKENKQVLVKSMSSVCTIKEGDFHIRNVISNTYTYNQVQVQRALLDDHVFTFDIVTSCNECVAVVKSWCIVIVIKRFI